MSVFISFWKGFWRGFFIDTAEEECIASISTDHLTIEAKDKVVLYSRYAVHKFWSLMNYCIAKSTLNRFSTEILARIFDYNDKIL